MHPLTFFSAVENQHNLDRFVICTKRSWRYENRLERFVRKIFHFIGLKWFETFLLRKVDCYMQSLFDRCEALPPEDLSRGCSLIAEPSLPLKRRIIALQCRLGEEHKETGNLEELIQLARQFKQKQYCFKEDEEITRYNQIQLEEAASVPDFCALLINDPIYRNQFFTWTLIEGNRTLPILFYPAHFKKLSDCLLSKRIGFYERRAKRAPVLQIGRQSLSFSVEGKRVNLLDPNAVAVDNLRVKDVFSIFLEKNRDVGPSNCSLEMFAGGEILVWNPKTFKRGNQLLNLHSKDWWMHIPAVEELTLKETSFRYKVNVDGKCAILSNIAKLYTPHYDLSGSHSYVEIAIPRKRKYRILTFGKFAWRYPKTIKEYLQVIVKTDRGVICSPDENIFNSERLQVANVTLISQERTDQFLNLVAAEIQRSIEGKVVFQFLAHNCTEWAQKLAQQIVPEIPEIYRISYNDFEIPGKFGKILHVVKNWKSALSALFQLLGSQEGAEYENFSGKAIYFSLYHGAPWNTKFLYHPARILDHHQKLIIHKYKGV
ncbi:MAG: hypothetical protein WD595_02035 [Waddliaceae bacterium]